MSSIRKRAKSRPRSKRPPANDALTVSVPAAGKLLGLGRNAAYEAAARGEIPSIRIGGRVLVPKVALQRLLAGVNLTNDVRFGPTSPAKR